MKIYERNQFNKESEDKYYFFEKSLCKTLIKQSTPKFLSSSSPLWHISKIYILRNVVYNASCHMYRICKLTAIWKRFQPLFQNIAAKEVTSAQCSIFFFFIKQTSHLFNCSSQTKKILSKILSCTVQYMYITYKIDLCIRFTA